PLTFFPRPRHDALPISMLRQMRSETLHETPSAIGGPVGVETPREFENRNRNAARHRIEQGFRALCEACSQALHLRSHRRGSEPSDRKSTRLNTSHQITL